MVKQFSHTIGTGHRRDKQASKQGLCRVHEVTEWSEADADANWKGGNVFDVECWSGIVDN